MDRERDKSVIKFASAGDGHFELQSSSRMKERHISRDASSRKYRDHVEDAISTHGTNSNDYSDEYRHSMAHRDDVEAAISRRSVVATVPAQNKVGDAQARFFFDHWYKPVLLFNLPLLLAAFMYYKTSGLQPFLYGGILISVAILICNVCIAHACQMKILKERFIILSKTQIIRTHPTTGEKEMRDVDLGFLGRLVLGRIMPLTPEILENFMTGSKRPYLWWQCRGPVLLPLGFGIALFALRYYLYINYEPVIMSLWGSMFYGTFGSACMYAIRTTYLPYQLMCIQIGAVLQNPHEIGLWNRSNEMLQQAQGLSFFLGTRLATALAFGLSAMLFTTSTVQAPVILLVICIYFLVSTVLAPIVQVTKVLSAIKNRYLDEVGQQIEDINVRIRLEFSSRTWEVREAKSDKLIEPDATQSAGYASLAHLKAELTAFESEVNSISVYPAGIKVAQSIGFSIFITVLPVVIGLRLGK